MALATKHNLCDPSTKAASNTIAKRGNMRLKRSVNFEKLSGLLPSLPM
jgi:hypothetical protein